MKVTIGEGRNELLSKWQHSQEGKDGTWRPMRPPELFKASIRSHALQASERDSVAMQLLILL